LSTPSKCFKDLVRDGIVRNGEYNTNTHDLIRDFYSPILALSKNYDRTTGSFSSTGIKSLARPLVHLIRNALIDEPARPVMRIVASHDITEEDYTSIVKGYKERRGTPEADLIAILEELRREPDDELLKAVRNIGTMVKLGLLDIKVAIPRNKLRGMYHRKIGIFTDFCKDTISFEGSQNVSFSGEQSEVNLEGLVAFCSSNPMIEGYKKEHRKFFDDLWSGQLPNVQVRPLDEYPRQLLASYAVQPETILSEAEPSGVVGAPSLRQHQVEAIRAWEENGLRGILDMCTGSGKSRVGLMAIETVAEPPLTVIVTGNLTDLIDQWAENQIVPLYGKENVAIVKISSVHGIRAKTEARLKEVVQDFERGFFTSHGKRVFVLAAIQSASQTWFRSIISRVSPSRLAVVIDEVHHAGAQGPTGNVLSIDANYRVGLSATWRRYDDDENGALERYFKGKNSVVAYNYPLSSGIKDGILSPYNYIIHPVSLDPADTAELRERLELYEEELTKIDPRLSLRFGDTVIERTPRNKWHRLVELRDDWRKTLGRAIARTDVALQTVEREYETLRKCIIYFADRQHLDRTATLMGKRGWSLEPYDSHVEKEIRKRIIEKFARPYKGQPFFIGAIKCLDEGIDLPALDSAILAASNKTEREWIQRRGRILRRSPGKDFAIIHDFVLLPFLKQQDAYRLSKAEKGYIESEMERLKAFAEDALNRTEALTLIEGLRRTFRSV